MIVPGYADLSLDALFVELDAVSADEASKLVWETLERVRSGSSKPQEEASATAWQQGLVAPDPLRLQRFGVELLPPAAAKLTPQQAWQTAHALQAALPNSRVEPTFSQPDDVSVTDLEGISGGDGAPAPGDAGWHLEAIRANAAACWLEQQDLLAGSDAIVGHPDTGYTEHPDIFGPGRPIAQVWGRDLLDADDDPLDPLDSGPLLQPGHGTATASVIASRAGNPIARAGGGPPADLRGVARAARILPLRVTRSVILLGWQRRLAQAVELAVARGCRVISMSVGGLGGRRLERALEEAESKGVIVVAAAGNEVGFVVAPAVYPSVVACAAIGPDEKPWSGSSRGSAVDISAPGHRVWVARWQNGSAVAAPGSGTSFATACVAGAAVLWLAAHAAKLKNRPEHAAKLFRAALRQTARSAPLPEGFGAGILDCAALVQHFPNGADAAEGVEKANRSAKEAMLEALIGARQASDLSRSLDETTASELAFYLTIDPALRRAWQSSSLSDDADGSEAVAAPRIPQRASARLRSMLRRARTSSPRRLVESSRIEPSASAPSPLTVVRETLSGGASVPAVASEIKLTIMLEVRVHVTGNEERS